MNIRGETPGDPPKMTTYEHPGETPGDPQR